MERSSIQRRRRRGSHPVIKKEISYPHLVKLEDWLTLMKVDKVADRLKSIRAHLAKEDIKKMRIAGVDHENTEDAKLVAFVSNMDSGPEIVEVEEGGKIELFVVALTMGPNSINTQFTPRAGKEQPKENIGSCPLRGVEREVRNL